MLSFLKISKNRQKHPLNFEMDLRMSDEKSSSLDWVVDQLKPSQPRGRKSLVNNFKREGWTDPHIFIREYLQNVLDSRESVKTQAEVTFRFQKLTTEEQISYYSDLLSVPHKHISASEAESRIDFEHPSVLVIEEKGTTGFTGDYTSSDADGNWSNFFFGEAKESKVGGKNGRAGQGKIIYYIVSMARTVFIVTKRIDDHKTLLMGNSNFAGTHMLEGVAYASNGFYCKESENQQPLPSTDISEINTFCSMFDIDCNSMTNGNYFVLPQPQAELNDIVIIQTICQDFFYPVLKGKLKIKLDSLDISNENLLDVYKNYRGEFSQSSTLPSLEYLKFIKECVYDEVELIRGSKNWNGKEDGFAEIFTLEEQEVLKLRFNKGETVAVEFPLSVTSKRPDIGNKSSPLKIFIKCNEEIKICEEAFIRTDLYIAKEKKLSNASAKHTFGLVIAEGDDNLLVDFLANAEEASHLSWNQRESKVEENFSNIKSTLSKVRTSLPKLYNFLIDSKGDIDDSFMLGLLSIPSETVKNKKGKKDKFDNKGDIATLAKPMEIIEKRTPLVVFTETPELDGFKFEASKYVEETNFPFVLEVTVALDNVRSGGDPFKNYSHLDFDFSDENSIKISVSGSELIHKDENKLRIKVDSPKFVLLCKGFSPNIPVKVNYKVKEYANED